MSLAVPAAVLAAEALDQFQEVTNGSFAFYQPQGDASAGVKGAAQTFTAGMSGSLSRIELNLARAEFPPDFMTTDGVSLEVHATDPGGALLATSVVVPSAAVPVHPAFAWIGFTFAAPASVTAGQTYAIVLPPDVTVNDQFDPTYLWAGTPTDVYANGMAWDRYGVDPTWYPYANGDDRTFRTYVDESEPEPTDADHDGVLDGDDLCPGTVVDAFPSLQTNRYAYNGTGVVSGLPNNPPHTSRKRVAAPQRRSLRRWAWAPDIASSGWRAARSNGG